MFTESGFKQKNGFLLEGRSFKRIGIIRVLLFWETDKKCQFVGKICPI